MEAQLSGVEPVWKPTRKPVHSDEPSGQPRSEPGDQRLSGRGVAAGQHDEDKHRRHRDQDGNAPADPFQGPPHQKACPMPR